MRIRPRIYQALCIAALTSVILITSVMHTAVPSARNTRRRRGLACTCATSRARLVVVQSRVRTYERLLAGEYSERANAHARSRASNTRPPTCGFTHVYACARICARSYRRRVSMFAPRASDCEFRVCARIHTGTRNAYDAHVRGCELVTTPRCAS